MTRSQQVVKLFCEGLSIEAIYTRFLREQNLGLIKKAFASPDEVEEVLRKAMRRHGRQGRK